MADSGDHTCSDDSLHLSELRIVLLGGRSGGKSSSGNTILGREEFDLRTAAQCVKRQGEVAGRQITVVDTPGWWWENLPVDDTPELFKQEIVLSVSLCPPGPHTLLLVIRGDSSFSEEDRRAVEGHLKSLSERVWHHTIVLFTHGDRLGDTSIEQHIDSEGKDLQWLVEKCGNRYHVLNNKNRDDVTQVTELLDKIEEMVAGNRGDHYEMKREILEKIEEKQRAENERATQRQMKVQEQRETLRSLMGDSLHLSELRIVLLGYREAGKSLSGNTILGREEFDQRTDAQCVKKQGEVAGRQITVVDTPGWWRNLSIEMTPELVKQEIVLSVALCPPGPHTLLLVLRGNSSFSEEFRRAVEGHLKLLSETVWNHTIVLFTYGDCLGDTSIEQHIESEGKDLQWLVEKCGNRYHVLNNKNRADVTQVTELLDKIEEMVAGNRGDHFEMKREILEKIEEKQREKEERVKQRQMKVQEQRETLRSLMGDSLHLSELRIVLLGYRYAGKSSSGNTILGREEFDLRTAAQCVKRQGEVAGRQVTVVDIPGWWSNLSVEETPELVKQEIVLSVSLCPPGPHTLLLVIWGGRSFSEEHRRAVEGHLKLLSETVWRHTVVLFTFGDSLGDTSIEQHIESEGKDLQWLVEKCGNRYHVLNNKNRADATQVTELLDKIEEMVAGNRGDHYEMKRELLEKIEEKQREKEERVKQRQMKVQKQRETLRSLMGDSLHLSELRIVLLGYRYAGKSSSGNIILGREEFDLRTAAQCVKRQGEVAGRQITVVDTPGWWPSSSIKYTPELVKQEIVLSVALCPPGPHTLLLVLRGNSSFSEEFRRAVEGHLKLLSETVWNHTIVLFTYGDCLGDTSIEQHIESEGKDLQWLVEKCGNRYHVLNNKNRDDVTQVTELLDKIEEMVAGNRGDHYEMKREILEKIEEKQREKEERVKQRQMNVQEQRETLRSLMGDSPHLSELRIVLLGYREAGKSSSGNTILGRGEFDLRTAAQCVKRQGEVAGRQITVVDTPGWWRNLPVENTPELVKQEIVLSVSLCPPEPHTLLLVIRGDLSFSEKDRRGVEEHLKLLSERVWNHTIVLFTYGDCLGDTSIEQHIESEGKDLQWLVEKCGNRYHVLNNKNRDDVTQVTELLDKIEEMVAGNRRDLFPEKIHHHKKSWLSGLMKKVRGQEPPIRRAESNPRLPPHMSEDDRSDSWSLRSSASQRTTTSTQSSAYGSLTSIAESETSSRSREDRDRMQMQMTPVKQAGSYEFIPPYMSEDDRSDSWSLRSSASQRTTTSTQSSAYGSLSSIAESETSSRSREDRDRMKMQMTPVKQAGSYELIPPHMSEDDRSDSRSLRSSASQRTRTSTQSSAYGSLSSREDRDRMKMQMTPVKQAGSYELLPPHMSGDTSSDTQSLRSSAYGSVTSLPAPGSEFRSKNSRTRSLSETPPDQSLTSETKEGSGGNPGETQDAVAESGVTPTNQ